MRTAKVGVPSQYLQRQEDRLRNSQIQSVIKIKVDSRSTSTINHCLEPGADLNAGLGSHRLC